MNLDTRRTRVRSVGSQLLGLGDSNCESSLCGFNPFSWYERVPICWIQMVCLVKGFLAVSPPITHERIKIG